MALDKLVDSSQLDTDLTSIANAIRTKGGTSASLAFPTDFVSAIQAISGGGGGLEYDAGTFTLASDYGGSSGGYSIPHNLGEIPAVIIVWTDYFDDETHTVDKNSNVGYVYLIGMSTLPQRLTSSTNASGGIAANMSISAGTKRIILGIANSDSYMPQAQRPTATDFKLNRRQVSASTYWIGGITYNYIVIKKWW